MIFKNRTEAGKQLAQKLNFLKGQECVVIGIPRGGVVVAYEISRELKVPLDIEIPRKIGMPHSPETAIGAVTEDGTVIWNQQLLSFLNFSEHKMKEIAENQVKEISRRTKIYRGEKPKEELENKNVILVDDGIATGYTIMAAIKSIKKRNPKKIILAVPVAPAEAIRELEKEVDQIICLLIPANFYAVGQFYHDFGQTSDTEVIELLKKANK